MSVALERLRGDVVRGTRAPFRPLMTGILAAFAVSLPVGVALSIATPLPMAVTSMASGASHALATFAVAGREVRRIEETQASETEMEP